ncbi:MAG: tetratricopeptide repeat protein [Bacteroidetes bacterium]|nr:MAG: tetratricopeptide repeat protein [Bacteroidota bacterium]TAF94096.1 MAG: tetratricopeptide repeat protein [Bacteroidota bacterium]
MEQDERLVKVDILIQHKKFADAEKILSSLLSEDANNIYVISLMAEVKLQQDQFEHALQLVDTAIGMAPDAPQLFYIKSRIAIQQDKLLMAESNIHQAIELDPYDDDYFALLANINLARKQFEPALEAANTALEINAENLLALNARSTALNKLNRSQESIETIAGALREDPNNAYTHANYGWGLLERGDYKKALEHFKEALANNPTLEYAQSGMVEALKATNPVYRMFLKYAFFMGNLTAKYQWGVLIGFYIGFKILRTIARNNEALQPYLIPLIILLAIVSFSTWIIGPISNVFLRFNKYGQFLLNKNEKISSNLVAISFAVFVLSLLSYFFTKNEKLLPMVVYGFAMMLPLGTMFSPSKKKHILTIFSGVLAVIGLLAIGITFLKGEVVNIFSGLFIFGFVAFQWVANYQSIKEDNRS